MAMTKEYKKRMRAVREAGRESTKAIKKSLIASPCFRNDYRHARIEIKNFDGQWRREVRESLEMHPETLFFGYIERVYYIKSK